MYFDYENLIKDRQKKTDLHSYETKKYRPFQNQYNLNKEYITDLALGCYR